MNNMIYKILRYVIALLTGIMGFMLIDSLMPDLSPIIDVKFLNMGFFGISLVKLLAFVLGGVIGAVIGYLIAPYILNWGLVLSRNLERLLTRIPSQDLITGSVGLVFGLIIANLIGVAFYRVPIVGPYIPIILSAILGYIGMRLMIRMTPDLSGFMQNVQNFRLSGREKKRGDSKHQAAGNADTGAAASGVSAETHQISVAKLLDTSVIIDGRIAELCRTGFLEGPLMVPLFVLEELQHISDSSDALKRNRGRRGLDILQAMQQEKVIDIQVIDDDYDDITEVDSKLMRLALEKGWKIITNDFNLNKVASLQGIAVLNLNELANALKPTMMSGEWIRVQVIKEGKENNQGVAYLDDGTMIVIENGAPFVNTAIDVMVTSVLQTSAGRMIFARPEGGKE